MKPPVISGGRFCEVLLRARIKGRAKSWTLQSVTDAKWSATGNSRVASCPWTPSCLIDDIWILRGNGRPRQSLPMRASCVNQLNARPSFASSAADGRQNKLIFLHSWITHCAGLPSRTSGNTASESEQEDTLPRRQLALRPHNARLHAGEFRPR